MLTVRKFEIEVTDFPVVMMPKYAEVLYAREQGDKMYVWARVESENELVPYRFRMAGTGHPLGEPCGKYIGSAHLHGGRLVFHVFAARPAYRPDRETSDAPR